MPKLKTHSWQFYDPIYEKRFLAFIEQFSGVSMNEKLNNYWETVLAPKSTSPNLETKLDTYFTCPITKQAAKLRELPCVENPNFLCKNPGCQAQVREMIKP